jgi:hypothetical protein
MMLIPPLIWLSFPCFLAQPDALIKPCPNQLTSQPARSSLSDSLAPGYRKESWPPCPKPPATRCPYNGSLKLPISKLSTPENTKQKSSPPFKMLPPSKNNDPPCKTPPRHIPLHRPSSFIILSPPSLLSYPLH